MQSCPHGVRNLKLLVSPIFKGMMGALKLAQRKSKSSFVAWEQYIGAPENVDFLST